MLHGLREVKLAASRHWAVDVFILRPTPKDGDPWGVLAPLRGTDWEQTIAVVGGDLLAHALHGHTLPLIRALKAEPKAQMVKMQAFACTLKEGNQCISASEHCRPSLKLPDCYSAPLEDPAARYAANVVALAWRKGYHVVVVNEDGEFAL